MENLEFYFKILVGIQLAHSLEEIFNRFEKRWPVWRMSRKFFVGFEIFAWILLLTVAFLKSFPARNQFMVGFNILMFANGIWHLMWAGVEKKYVPGLITAPFFVVIFLLFYFQLFF